MNRNRRLLVAVAMTGLTALALEVIWSRAMIPWVGGTALSQITTVAIYMAGLFLGSAIAVRTLPRFADPRRAFIKVEIGAALLSLAAVLALPLADPLFALFSKGELLGSGMGSVLRGLSGGGLMLPATILMGLSFPLAIAAIDQGQAAHRSKRGSAALAYGVNTLGATLGTFLGGFLLVPHLGVTLGAVVVVAADVLLLAWAWADPEAAAPAPMAPASKLAAPAHPATTPPAGAEPSTWQSELPMLLAITLGGAVSLGLEAVLFRVLGLLLGPTARAFTVVLGVYVLGLGLGSLLVRRIVEKSRGAAELVYLVCWFVVGGLGIVIHRATGQLSEFIATGRTEDVDMASQLLRRALVSTVVLLPLTCAFGASYSAAVAAARKTDPRRAGRLYAALTLGNIVGLGLAAWLLLPRYGLDHGLLIVLAAAFLAPLPALLGMSLRGVARLAIAALLLGGGALALFGTPAWPMRLQHTAAYMYDRVKLGQRREVILFHRSAFETTVTVVKNQEDLYLQLDGKTTGSTDSDDQATQGLLGALPAALHPDPKKVFIIGLGTGQTPGELLRHPVERCDCAEISPEVVDTMPFFAAINRRCDQDPRFHMLEADGRTVLRYGATKYDLVISEPSNVWIPGVAHLFTRESFADVRGCLEPEDGLCAQWMQGYTLEVETLRTVVRTFLTVFPDSSLWFSGFGAPDVFLIGSVRPLTVDVDALEKRLATLQSPDFNCPNGTPSHSLTVEGLLRCFIAGPETLRKFAGEGPLTADSHPSLEYAAERALLSRASHHVREVIAQLAESPAPLLVNAKPDLLAILERRATVNRVVNRLLVETERRGGAADLQLFTQLHFLAKAHPDDLQLRYAAAGLIAYAAGDALMKNGNSPDGRRLHALARELDPNHPRVLEVEASLQATAGRFDEALRVLVQLGKVEAPWRVNAKYERALLLQRFGRPAEAVPLFREVVVQDSNYLPAWRALAEAEEQVGNLEGALAAWQRLIALDPEDTTLRNEALRVGLALRMSRPAR